MTDTMRAAESPRESLDPQRAPASPAAIAYVNGEFVSRADARVSADDRGFLFGDGGYEVTRAIDGRLFEADRHRARLARTLRGLRIDFGDDEIAALDSVALRLLRDNDLLQGEATVYVQVTRGAALPRTHHFPPKGTRPTVYLAAQRFVTPRALRERGGSAITVPDIRWSRCDLKTVNLLPNAMAKQQATEAGCDEALFVRDGVVMEGAHTNVSFVLDGELRTAPLTNYILGGVTRDVVLELAREAGIPVREYPLHRDEVARASEAFLTSTTSDVQPIVTIDGAPVGDGKPGPVARRLLDLLEARMRA